MVEVGAYDSPVRTVFSFVFISQLSKRTQQCLNSLSQYPEVFLKGDKYYE